MEVATEIRPATTKEAVAVARIYAPYVLKTAITFETEPPTAEAMAQRIAKTVQTHPWLIADRGGEIVGFAYASKHSERPAYRWTVNVTVYVSDGVRQSGVGRALYDSLLTTLREQGFRSAFAEIVLPNPASIKLHENAGFKKIGVHEDIGFKLGRWHDIGYWRLGLADGSGPPREPIPFPELQARGQR